MLAVDDEPDSLDLLRTVLEGAGATVSTARSGPEALDAIRREVPDVLIADVGMPGMDGLQLIRAIRQMPEPARSVPAAALTAYARSQDRITSLASGFHMHLVKPIDPLELVVAVATLAPRRLGHLASRRTTHGRARSAPQFVIMGADARLRSQHPAATAHNMANEPSLDTQLPGSSSPLASTVAEVVDRELKACLDHAAEGLHFVGPDGTILWANQTELDLLGYSREEYIGHNITEFHVDPPVIEDILARLTRGETLLNYEARLRRKDGSIRFVQINSNVLWRDDEFLHTRCFTRDITDRKAADELARRLADIVEHSEDAIISQDLDGQITSWNPAAERMYGYAAAEAIGQPIRLIIPADREHEEADVVLRVRNGERVPPFETRSTA